jgi:hypothetical protein
VLERSNEKFEFPVNWGIDLQSEHERYLTEKYAKKPVIVMNYPKAIIMLWRRHMLVFSKCDPSKCDPPESCRFCRHSAKQLLATLGSFGSYSHAHRQLENLPSLKQCLVEAVDHRSAMIVGDSKVESVSGL